MEKFYAYRNCRLCPRECNVNRLNGTRKGYCGETDQLTTGYVGPHFGEEPPITGSNGSGTVFLSGCSLKCSFCQNHQISHQGLGDPINIEELALKLEGMIRDQQIHNINFVTPDHFFPHVFELIATLKNRGFDLPIVFNTSGYQSIEMLKAAEPMVDIYLPDYKYSDETLAENLSRCRDYPEVALAAIFEMVRQKGFLDVFQTQNEIAGKGVLVRHLIIPGHLENSMNALTTLFLEFGSRLPLSLMSQYYPVCDHEDPDLNRTLSELEFYRVYNHAKDLGFENLYVQFPEQITGTPPQKSRFLPDFTSSRPFG